MAQTRHSIVFTVHEKSENNICICGCVLYFENGANLIRNHRQKSRNERSEVSKERSLTLVQKTKIFTEHHNTFKERWQQQHIPPAKVYILAP